MEEPNKPSHFVLKVAGTTFVVVIAPIISGLALYFIQKKLDTDKSDPAPQPAASVAVPKTEMKDVSKPASSPPSTVPTPPTPTAASPPKKNLGTAVRLFNGKDLSGFDTYLGTAPAAKSKTAIGTNKDPEKVFTAHLGELRISGKYFGGLVTTKEYENYRLTLQYKWGQKKWPPREDLPRLSGLVLHATGWPGAIRGWTMAGIGCFIGENDTGALSLPEGLTKPISLSVESEQRILKKAERTMIVYKPGEPLTTVSSGLVHRLGYRPTPAAKATDASKPLDEWNTLECECDGDRITVTLNGKVVNMVSNVSRTRGKIFIESQGAEILFRKIELRPLVAASLARP